MVKPVDWLHQSEEKTPDYKLTVSYTVFVFKQQQQST